MIKAVLGIDTSNYTTSAALVALDGRIIADSRKLLPVKPGEVGLRQSDALFLHIRQWPQVFAGLPIKVCDIVAVAVSVAPRREDGSYMPVFMAGRSLAATAAHALSVPMLGFSHQEGHVRAALSGKAAPLWPFLAVHISGGTTDVLYVNPLEQVGYDVKLVASSSDLHAGQFVDRVGVHMGLDFPCGKALDSMAASFEGQPYDLPSSVKGAEISFSGPASAAIRAIDAGIEHGAIALGVFRCIANSLEKVLRQNLYPTTEVVLCGGVASNTFIRQRLVDRLHRYRFILAPVSLASDNAVGTALLGVDSVRAGVGTSDMLEL